MTNPYGNNYPHDRGFDPYTQGQPDHGQYGQNDPLNYQGQQPYAQGQAGQAPFNSQQLQGHYAGQPQHNYSAQPSFGPLAESKSQVAAALLAFFLGTWGAHNFYLGYTKKAVTQLVLWLLGWITAIFLIGFVLVFVVAAWALIEFIMILMKSGSYSHDAKGVPLGG